MDRRRVELFNRYGLKTTFHLNSGLLEKKEGHRYPYVEAGEVRELYRGHEIAWSYLYASDFDTNTEADDTGRDPGKTGKSWRSCPVYPVIGMSHPCNGSFQQRDQRSHAPVRNLLCQDNKRYRQIRSSGDDDLEWNPTCRHTGPLMELTREFREPGVRSETVPVRSTTAELRV